MKTCFIHYISWCGSIIFPIFIHYLLSPLVVPFPQLIFRLPLSSVATLSSLQFLSFPSHPFFSNFPLHSFLLSHTQPFLFLLDMFSHLLPPVRRLSIASVLFSFFFPLAIHSLHLSELTPPSTSPSHPPVSPYNPPISTPSPQSHTILFKLIIKAFVRASLVILHFILINRIFFNNVLPVI